MVEGCEVNDDRGHTAVDGLDLQVRAGEIVGVAGVEGNGQRELVEALCGMRPPKGGRVHARGARTSPTTRRARSTGSACRTSPRTARSTASSASYSVASNLVLERFDEPPFAKGIIRDFEAVARQRRRAGRPLRRAAAEHPQPDARRCRAATSRR